MGPRWNRPRGAFHRAPRCVSSPQALYATQHDHTSPRRLARAVSNVLNPFVIFTALFALVAFTEAGAYKGPSTWLWS